MKIELNERKYWEIAQLSNVSELFPGESRIIKALKDLYPVIKSSINRDPVVSNLTECIESFISLLYGLKGFSSSIVYKKNYRMKIDICPKDFTDHELYFISIDFLPQLRKRNKLLHNIVVEAIKLLVIDKSVPIFGNGQLDNEEWFFGECDDNENEELQQLKESNKLDLKAYQKIFSITQKSNMPKLMNLMAKFQSSCKAEEIIIEWVNILIQTYQCPHNLHYFNNCAEMDFIEEYRKQFEEEMREQNEKIPKNDDTLLIEYIFDNGYPLSLFGIFEFCWYSNQDFIEDKCNVSSQIGNEFGQYWFSQSYECSKDNDLKSCIENYEQTHGRFLDWLCKSFTFFNENEEIIRNYCTGKLIEILDEPSNNKQLCSL